MLCGQKAEFSVLVADAYPEITFKGDRSSYIGQGFIAHYKQVNDTLGAISGKSRKR